MATHAGAQRSQTARTRRAAADDVVAASRALVGIAVRSLAALDDQEVTLPQFRALLLVIEGRVRASGDLAEALGVHPSNSSRLVDRMVAKDLLARAEGPDRRQVELRVTESGHALVRQVLETRRRLIVEVVKSLDPGEAERVGASLRAFAVAAGEPADDAWWLGWG